MLARFENAGNILQIARGGKRRGAVLKKKDHTWRQQSTIDSQVANHRVSRAGTINIHEKFTTGTFIML